MTDRGDPAAEAWESERAARRAAEEAAAQLQRLEATTAALSGARTPDAVAEVALSAGLAALGASRGIVLVPDPAGAVLSVLRTAGVGDRSAWHAARDDAPNPTREAWLTGAPVFVPDRKALAERYPALAPIAERMAGEAVAALPLASGERTLGILAVVYDAPRAFDPGEQMFAAAVARRCAEALERARMYVAERLARAEAVAARSRLAFLDQLSRFLAGAPGEVELLAGVVRLAVPALADWAGVLVVDGAALRPLAEAGPDALGAGARAALAAHPDGTVAAALRGSRPAALEPVAGGPSLAVACIAANGESVGALVLVSEDPARRYGAEDLGLVAEVANRTGGAIGRARTLRDAQLAVRVREDFLHVASHELRGPLGTLRIALQLAAREADAGAAGAARQRLGIAQRQVERMVKLSERLLDVSRITSGRLELQRAPGDLTELARDVTAQLAEDAAAAGCPVTLRASGPVCFEFDSERLEEVLTNLLTNAFKYGRGAPITITIGERDGRALLEIRDHGIGIAPEDRERIFQRFERAVSARNYTGFGLGLWIVRRLVEAHGGTVRVESAPGDGAAFLVELPMSGGDGQPPALEA
jgi:signal transduction histidine kinase